jgi:hypothetical protein
MRVLRAVFHTLIAALLPVLVLVWRHVPSTPLTTLTVLRASAAMLAVTIALLLALRPVWPGLRHRAVTVTTWWFLLPLYPLFASVATDASATRWGELSVAAAYVALCTAIAIIVGRRFAGDSDVAMLNVLACAVCAAVAGHLLAGLQPWSTPEWAAAARNVREPVLAAPLRRPPISPDVYYIILDGMERPDLLGPLYGVDSDWFVRALRSSGFTVADRSRSNYVQTLLSLSSSLNGSYLNGLEPVMGSRSDRRPLRHLVEHSAVIERFRALGYEFVMVGSDAPGTITHAQADRCYCGLVKGPSEFDSALFRGLPVAALRLDPLTYRAHRRKVQDSFEAVENVKRAGRPLFVFAHFLVPHPPFVFNVDGSARVPDVPFSFKDGTRDAAGKAGYAKGYGQQVVFVMRRVLQMIQAIEAKGGTPVIVVQGDHGGGSGLDWDSAGRIDLTERLGILAAVRLPGGAAVPPDLTPVNVFRLVFNQVFGGHLPMLPNRSYFSGWYEPYRFVEAPPE